MSAAGAPQSASCPGMWPRRSDGWARPIVHASSGGALLRLFDFSSDDEAGEDEEDTADAEEADGDAVDELDGDSKASDVSCASEQRSRTEEDGEEDASLTEESIEASSSQHGESKATTTEAEGVPEERRDGAGPALLHLRDVCVEAAFDAGAWSSENEEDRRHPSSLRAKLKRIFAEVLEADDDDGGVATLCVSMERAMRLRRGGAPVAPGDPPTRAEVPAAGATEPLAAEDEGATLCARMERSLSIHCGAGSGASPGAKASGFAAPPLAQESGCYAAPELDVPMPPSAERDSLPPVAVRAPTGSSSGFACRRCGHTFSLRRTRDMHARVCQGG